MRLHFNLTPNRRPVPFDYQHSLTGTFHKWLGENDLHDHLSLYSLSWLDGGRLQQGALDSPEGARWFISIFDESLAEAIVNTALSAPNICCGMRVNSIEQQTTPDFGPCHMFRVGSPVLVRSKEIEGRVRHYIYSDPEADEALTGTLRHKIATAGLGDEHMGVTVKFDRDYGNPKTKLVKIKNTSNRASICPVIVEGTPRAVSFAWDVGV